MRADSPWMQAMISARSGMQSGERSVNLHGVVRRRPGAVVLRRAKSAHRVALVRDSLGYEKACWTLFLTGPRVRDWGFWCPNGWRHWHEFTDPEDSGRVGPGCD